jgi:ribosomal-protein-alanine N-acetyltransferase
MIPHETVILSKRLRLRRFSKSDIPFVFSASRYVGFCDGMRWSPPEREDELLEPCLANEQAWQSGAAYVFTIESLSTAESLGRIAVRRQEGSLWDLGFWTHPLHQRQGYMTEATAALIEFGFVQLGASEIQAAHATWNVASRRVLEQAGLHFIRHVPEGFQKNGEWIEEDLLSITRQQWEQQTEQPRSRATPLEPLGSIRAPLARRD